MTKQLLKHALVAITCLVLSIGENFAQDLKLQEINRNKAITKGYNSGLLYGQTSNPVSFGIASQEFPDFPAFSCQAADDFFIPAGENWMIENIQVTGFYSVNGGPVQMVNLALVQNNPEINAPGNPVVMIPGFPAESDPTGNLQFDFGTNPLLLPAGHYWLTVQPVMTFTDFGQWFWAKQAAPTLLNEFHWQNPGSGWNLPNTYTWQKASLINWGSTSTDWNLGFALYGTANTMIDHDFSLVVGDYHNPEPWHDWIGGNSITRLQVTTEGSSANVSGVDFFFSPDGVEWNLFYHDSDGTMLAENTTIPGPQGDGWAGYFTPGLIPQQDMLLSFKAAVTFLDGTTTEQTRNIRFDPTPPSGIQINIQDFMIIQDNTILLEIEPGTCTDLSYCEVKLVTKPEYFNKGVPHITQPTGTTCAPTAAAACLKWFGGEVTGGLSDAELIDALKEACKTDQGKSGTNPDDLAKGLRDWIAAHGDGYTVRGPLPFDWKQMRNELERGQDVLSGIVWTGGGGHRMTFNSIKNTPEPDGKIRIDFMDPWTGQEEWGYVDPATGELTGFTGAGASGTLGNVIIICPKESTPTPGTGTILPGPNPPAITIPVSSPGLYFLRINAVDNSGNASRIDLVVNKPIDHDFSLVVGDYHNPEPWHDWIGGNSITRLQVTTEGSSANVSGVDFFFSPDGVEWNLFYHDSDGTMLAENTTIPGPQGDGWAGYFSPDLIPQQDLILTFKAAVTFLDGTTAEQTHNIRFDPTPPSGIQINIEDFMIIQDNTILLEIEPGTCTDLSYCEVELVTKPEYFNKGVPHITQPTGTTCAPTAAAACLQWFGGEVTGGLSDAELIDALKGACKTDQGVSGTTPDNLAKGLREWIAAHGDGYTVRGPLPFNWEQMRNELERGQDVLSGIVWTGGGGHRMTFNSIKNTPEPDGKIRIDFMDPWTGDEEWGYVDPATGELTGFTGAGASGTLGNIIIVCPKETSPTPGTGTILPGPNPPAITIPVPSPGLYFLRINAVDNSGNVSRIDLVVNNVTDMPVIEIIDEPQMHFSESIRLTGLHFGEPEPGACLLFSGIGFCSPETWTYWSDDQVFFNCPDIAPGLYELQVQRNDGSLSNPVTVEVILPGEIAFLSPYPDERIMDEFIDIKAVMPVARSLIDSVRLYATPQGSTDRIYLGTDYDGTVTSAGTYVPIGEGDGWSKVWYPPFWDVFYSISAEGFCNNGMIFNGSVDVFWDVLPYQIKILDQESKTVGGKTPDEDSISIIANIDETMIDEIFAGMRPLGGFDFTRLLVHIDQNDVEAKDADNNDISNDICGPVAAAVCLDWLNKRAGGTGYQSIQDSIRKIARKAGTKAGSGTWDDKLTDAINEMLKKDPKIKNGKVTRYDKSSKPYNKIAKNLRDSADVIIMIHQKLKDGTVVGHYVTVSSHHTEISYQGIGPDGTQGCVAVQKDYIDFMDPATGETTYKEAKWYNNPPTIADYKIGNQENDGEAWIESTIVVSGDEGKNSRDYGYVWNTTITPNGTGQYVISALCSEIPEGVFAFELTGTTAKSSTIMEFTVVVNGQYEPFASFTANHTSGVSPFTVQFDDLSLPPDSITSWKWDFGDGEESLLQEPQHTYQNPGIYSVTLIVSDGVNSDTLAKTDYIKVTVPVCHSISLPQGWSGVSSYIQPSDPDIPALFAPITDDLIILYNFNTMLYPAGGIIPDEPWDSQSGYVVKMSDDVSFSICGSLIDSPMVSLKAGWNIMPVTSSGYVDVALTFGDVPQVYVAKDVAGSGIYWKLFGINSLPWMIPGKSYFVYSTEDVDVLLQGSSTSTKSVLEPSLKSLSPWNEVVATAESHITAFPASVVVEFQIGDLIGVFNSLGRCCGTIEFTGNPIGLTAFGKDPQLSLYDGFVQNETLKFRLFRSATKEYFNLETRFDPEMANYDKYFPHGFSLVTSVILLTDFTEEPQNEITFELFPNPSKGILSVVTNISNPVLEIMNSKGEVVLKSEIAANQLDISALKPGIYFLRIVNFKSLIVKKLIID